MATNWALPSSIEQYSEDQAENIHISWIGDFNNLTRYLGRSIKTAKDLLHIARDPRHDVVDKTYYLRATNFNFNYIPDIISGIEVRLSTNRYGRITDDTVQLCLDNDLIGVNQATLDLSPIKIYGGEDVLWNAASSKENLQNSSFGLTLRFKSHPSWPHKCSMLISAIEIRVH